MRAFIRQRLSLFARPQVEWCSKLIDERHPDWGYYYAVWKDGAWDFDDRDGYAVKRGRAYSGVPNKGYIDVGILADDGSVQFIPSEYVRWV